jgi:hypothetical protein
VDNVYSWKDYFNLVGKKRMDDLSIKHHDISEPVDYGY